MSYSFSVRGATKAEIIGKVAAEFDKVVASQPVHSADRAHAQACAEAFLGFIPDDPGGQDFYISVSGSVGWNGTLGAHVLTSAGVNVSASLVNKV